MIIITIPNLMVELTTFIIKIMIFGSQKKNPFHGKNDMKHDLNGLYVLISDDFYYFGKKR